MPTLNPSPKIKLSRLRDIGWTLWDPIGLLPAGEKWDDEGNRSFADEYDSFLIHAAGQLRRGTPDVDVVSYLIEVESEHMGLGESRGARERAEFVVAAIRRADDSLWT
ncbi:hypothetical protein ABLO27_21580 [Roseibium sp. SCPC15]|uniref:hypothetical protein n=1 Tax=Roseibium sp. SCP15 TaxID=3141376 RepID=UPI00333CF12E